jgi:drug/metabolite transporter (DMT)-like permease
MVLGSAASFGTLPIIVKFAYASGLSPLQALTWRFVLAGAGLHVVLGLKGESLLGLGLARIGQFLLLGILGYAAQSGTYFGALCCLPASLVELIAYIYPSLVVLGAWLVFRRPIRGRDGLALAISFVGLGLLVGGVRLQAGSPLLLAFTSPILYSIYILAGDRFMRGSSALAASAMVHTGAAAVFVVISAASGQLSFPQRPAGWVLVVLLALVPSMLAISLFLAGLPRIGAGRASLLSTCEPVVTVTLAVVLLGDRLAPTQLLGAAGIVVAVVIVQLHSGAARPATQFRD